MSGGPNTLNERLTAMITDQNLKVSSFAVKTIHIELDTGKRSEEFLEVFVVRGELINQIETLLKKTLEIEGSDVGLN